MSSSEELLCDSADVHRGALLGGGTFGQVYRSEHSRWGSVAERVVPKLPAEQEERVRDAIKPLYRLRCDNATRLYGLVLHPGNYSLLVEYAQFGPVEELIKVKPPWAVRAKVMREVAMGLKYLHAHHVVHGNLSRHNVVISSDLVAKVTDFGLRECRVLASSGHGGDMGATADTLLVDTGPYAPPEAFAKSVSEALTCSFDIYSYGILSWELITSEHAWKGLSPQELRSEMQKGRRPVLRGGQHFPAACPLTMTYITTEAWGQQPDKRPAMSDIARRMVKKKDVQWSSDELRTAENEARKKLTDALRVSTRARTPRQGPVSAGLSSQDAIGGLSPRGSTKTRRAEREVPPQTTQVSPRVSQVQSRRAADLQARGPSRRATGTPVTKQGERKESLRGKFKPPGSRVDDPEKTTSSKPHASGSGSVRKNAPSSGSLKSAERGREVVGKTTTRSTDTSQSSRSSRGAVQTLVRDEGFSESSFTDDQMSHDDSQCESGAAGGQSDDLPAIQAEAPAGLSQVHLAFTEHPTNLRADQEAGLDAQLQVQVEEGAGERVEVALFPEPDQQRSGSSTPPDQAEPSNQDACPDQHEEAEPVTSQNRGQLQPDLVLDVPSESQQSAGTDVPPETGDTDSDEEQISSSVDSHDETSVKVPLGEKIETPESDSRVEGGEENTTQQNNGLEVSTTPQQSQALPHAQTLQHQSQFLSHGGTDQVLNEAGPVGEINQQSAEQLPTQTTQQEQNRPASEEMVTAMAQLWTGPQVTGPGYPAVIYYDEADPDIDQVKQVVRLVRHTWGLHVFDPHHDGLGDKMASFRDSFENCQHAVVVLTPAVIRDMQERRPNTASFRIATFLTGLLETRDEQTCRRRLIPVQIGRDQIPFILCNFHVLQFGTSGFHRKLYRAVGSQTGVAIRDLKRWVDQMPQSEHTVNTVAEMLRLPPMVLTDIKQEFGGSRSMLIELLECWCLYHGACATDLRLRQVVAAVAGGQGSCVRGQDQVQAAAPGGQGSSARGQDQVQGAAPGVQGQDEIQRHQYVEHQAPADMITLLRTNRMQLIDTLRYNSLVKDHLFSRGVITQYEMDIIKGHSVQYDQARELLDIIATKGERGCAELKSVLAEEAPHATALLETKK